MDARYLPRDFIETPDGLLFAVVDQRLDDGRVPCFLRYRRAGGRLIKLDTAAAQDWLMAHAPRYRYDSERLATTLHGVRPMDIVCHHRPRARVASLMRQGPRGTIETRALQVLTMLVEGGLAASRVGLTGSLLIGAQHAASDIDFVFYQREAFHRARAIVGEAIAGGRLAELDPDAWRAAYARRGCELGFDEYLWHERRKCNKGLCQGVKFDLTLVALDGSDRPGSMPARKLGAVRFDAVVTDATGAFDFPARYRLDHPDIAEAWSFTQTYAGQALPGERVEIAGQLEETSGDRRRVIVGSSREARGEYIRVKAPISRPGDTETAKPA